MSTKLLLEKISTLKEQYNFLFASSLHKKIHLTYTLKILNNLKRILKENSVSMIDELEEFLALNWQQINSSSLGYTALPENELTLLLCEVSEVIAKIKDKPPIKVLMPTVATDSLIEAYPDLSTQDIRWVLKNHILGRSGDYLIPVKYLIELESNPNLAKLNIYYDYQLHSDEFAFLNNDECERLITHSPETEAFHNALKEYNRILLANDNLLVHLRNLCQSLYINSVKGIGDEKNAGQGVYPAIIRFNEYYSRLSEQNKLKIPTNIKEEIDLLLELSTNSAINHNATENLNTCIATRRSKLEEAINPVESVLSAIGLNEIEQNNLIIEKKNLIALTQKNLNLMIELETQYHGTDKLYLSSKLMKDLNVDCTISSMADLNDFMKFSPREINDFCKDNGIKTQILNQFATLESLIFFTIEAKLLNMKALFTIIMPELQTKFFHSAAIFNAFLYTIDKDRAQIILEIYKDNLPISFSTWDFTEMIRRMQSEERKNAFNLMKDYIPNLIKSTEDFKTITYYLSIEQKVQLLDLMKEKLPGLCFRKYDVVKIFCNFSDDDFKNIKIILPNIILGPLDFIELMECSSSIQRDYIFDAMVNQLPQQKHDAFSLKKIFNLISEEQRTQAFEVLKMPLATQIKSWRELVDFLALFTPNQCESLLEEMKKNRRLSIIINTIDNFDTMPQKFEPASFKIIIQAIKNDFAVNLDLSKFFSFVRNSNPEQFLYTSEGMKDCLINLSSKSHIRYIFRQITEKLKDDDQVIHFLQLVQEGIQWNQVDKKYLQEEIFKYHFKTQEQRLAFLQLLPNLAELISYKELKQFTSSNFNDHLIIHRFHELYFNKLILNLNNISDDTDDEDKRTIKALFNSLNHHSDLYFQKYPSKQNFEIFKNSCNQAIEQAQSQLINPDYCSELLTIIALTIFSLGIIPAIMSVTNKIMNDSWEVRLFKTKTEKELDEILSPVNSFLNS
ncbi:MAG: hypothetical protein H0T84_06110 [Tatlockia sp.]|nr:hypothetical protein [Tatlockia sp.]